MIKEYNQKLNGLELTIINKINKLERRKMLKKESVYALISIISFLSIIPSMIYLFNMLSSSGLYSYISLIFSDIETLSYWKELSFSILESLPFFGIAIVLGMSGIFLWSLLKTLRIQIVKSSILLN